MATRSAPPRSRYNNNNKLGRGANDEEDMSCGARRSRTYATSSSTRPSPWQQKSMASLSYVLEYEMDSGFLIESK
ncbi:unnamed protein product, partial [Nesidiocoris tenuis]